jgi:hypothetical protein
MNKLLNVWISLAILAAVSCGVEDDSVATAGAAGAVSVDREALSVYCSVANNANWFEFNFPQPPEGNWQNVQVAKNPPAVPQALLYSSDRSTLWIYSGSSTGHRCDNSVCDYTFTFTTCDNNAGTCIPPQNRGTLHCVCVGSNGGYCTLQ